MNQQTRKTRYLFIGIFSILCVILIGVMIHKYRVAHSDIRLHSTKTNTAKTFRYSVQKEMTADQAGQDFQPGYYDVHVTNGKVYVSGFLGSGQTIQNMLYVSGNHLNFTGHGETKLTPSHFKPLQFKSRRAVLENTFGNYTAGREIPAGKYQISWSTPTKRQANLVISIQKGTKVQRSIDLRADKMVTFKLAKAEVLAINPPVTTKVVPLRITITKK
ncbi:hypothetical protein [Lactiplantibacillus paraplantarum]|uniref:Uncharacterized protein n=1 Tax=Lactiplantibacillus paraplantarum TaxID=60520 RepID=A0AAD0TMI7_9LACO|nr:hypothetical protein [Lactiplantibacillus paraplantarum]AVW09432.1 hypothetical protein DA077_02185 [Lactiplantibacillus paraplantarum]AYJ37699.1 hypothetical protein LP667_02090 [Lactiplantibacillus paraplantarum]ERL43606.1 hypothetical protein N644_2149 [Lactiplantibacillus paraplantarum]MCU4682650.1 hypothetical protein [Lactiplantibacillus paraplantarum]MDL2063417.1 hypothetical protein [Lactiplantibacillus paraplantarum]